MKPKVTLRHALEDPALLATALAGPTWVAWRAILLAAMDESQRPLGPKAMPPWREKNPEGLRIGTGGSR